MGLFLGNQMSYHRRIYYYDPSPYRSIPGSEAFLTFSDHCFPDIRSAGTMYRDIQKVVEETTVIPCAPWVPMAWWAAEKDEFIEWCAERSLVNQCLRAIENQCRFHSPVGDEMKVFCTKILQLPFGPSTRVREDAIETMLGKETFYKVLARMSVMRMPTGPSAVINTANGISERYGQSGGLADFLRAQEASKAEDDVRFENEYIGYKEYTDKNGFTHVQLVSSAPFNAAAAWEATKLAAKGNGC